MIYNITDVPFWHQASILKSSCNVLYLIKYKIYGILKLRKDIDKTLKLVSLVVRKICKVDDEIRKSKRIAHRKKCTLLPFAKKINEIRPTIYSSYR